VQAQKEGASTEAVAASQRTSVLLSLGQALALAGIDEAVSDRYLAVAGQPDHPLASSHDFSQGDQLPRLLMIIGGLFGLRLRGDASAVAQITDARTQLLSKGIDLNEAKRRVYHAVQSQPDLQGPPLKQLLALLD
jgi:hypothetical protein